MVRRSRIEVFEGGFIERFEYVDDSEEHTDDAHEERVIGPSDDGPDDGSGCQAG